MHTRAPKQEPTEQAGRSTRAKQEPFRQTEAADSILRLQAAAGNAAVLSLLGFAGDEARGPQAPVQPRLRPGEALSIQRQSPADIAAAAATHRRWIREADLSILLHFSPELLASALISTEFPGLLSLESSSQVVDEPTFVALFTQQFNRPPTPSELQTVRGFTTPHAPKQVVLRRDSLKIFSDLDFETVLHEGLHYYSSESFYTLCGEGVGDGVTVYFAQALAAAAQRPAEATGYQGELDAVKQLLAATGPDGESSLRQAYFFGRVSAIENMSHGESKFRPYFWDWAEAVNNNDFGLAEEALHRWGMTGEITMRETPGTR